MIRLEVQYLAFNNLLEFEADKVFDLAFSIKDPLERRRAQYIE